jgi:hypothetical protein
MIQSRFDTFVNKILRESLQGGNITSTSVGPAKPQDIDDSQETTEDDGGEEIEQLPIPNTQQSTKQQTPVQQVASNASDDVTKKAEMDYMKKLEDFLKKQEEFQKKTIATQTAAMKTNPTQQTVGATNVQAPTTGNVNVAQALNNLLNMKA